MQPTADCFVLNENEKPFLYHAKQIGSRAKGLLAQHGFSGKVLAVLSASVYLVSGDGEILWMSQQGLAMHRRCILVSFRPRSISVGQNFFVDGPWIRFPEGTTVDLEPATEWKPSGVGPGNAEPLPTVQAHIRQWVEAVTRLGNAKGLGRMISLISSVVGGKKQAISNADPFLAKARNAMLDLTTACFDLDMTEVARRSRELVGLGPGLTPSGDDFLGGLLFAAHALKTAYPQHFRWEDEPVMDLIEWASTQTHPISHAILRDHALGHGPKPLHDVVVSLLNGRDLSRTLGETERLLGIGETSGWDILAGMVTAMLFVEGELSALPA